MMVDMQLRARDKWQSSGELGSLGQKSMDSVRLQLIPRWSPKEVKDRPEELVSLLPPPDPGTML